MQRSLQTTTNATGKFWTHAGVEHTQDPDFIAYTQPIQEVVGHRSVINGYGLVVGRGKTYFGVLA